jgi:hypothetical protein
MTITTVGLLEKRDRQDAGRQKGKKKAPTERQAGAAPQGHFVRGFGIW